MSCFFFFIFHSGKIETRDGETSGIVGRGWGDRFVYLHRIHIILLFVIPRCAFVARGEIDLSQQRRSRTRSAVLQRVRRKQRLQGSRVDFHRLEVLDVTETLAAFAYNRFLLAPDRNEIIRLIVTPGRV
jgi:hypothetical protein